MDLRAASRSGHDDGRRQRQRQRQQQQRQVIAKPFSRFSESDNKSERLCAVVLGAARVGKTALSSRFALNVVPFQDDHSESSDDFGLLLTGSSSSDDSLGASSIEEDACWSQKSKGKKAHVYRQCALASDDDPLLPADDCQPTMTVYDAKGPRGEQETSSSSALVDDGARRLLASRAGCVVVYAVHRRESFELAGRVLAEVCEILKLSGRQTPGMLVANKAEKREHKHEVTRAEGEELAARYGCGFIATSATSHGHFSSPNGGGFSGSPTECAKAELEELRIENAHVASVFGSLLTRHRARQFIGTPSETKSANFRK